MQSFSPVDREAFLFGLTAADKAEVFSETFWHKVYTYDGKVYVLAQNIGEVVQTVEIPVSVEYLALLYGGNATLSAGQLTSSVLPGSILFLAETDGTQPGLYRGGVLYSHIADGVFTLRSAQYAAVYTEHEGSRELLELYTPGEITITSAADSVYILNWNADMMPKSDPIRMYR